MAAPTTTTTAVTTAAALLGTVKGSRRQVIVTNPPGSGVTVYIGGSTVSSTNYTWLLAPGDQPLVIDPPMGEVSVPGWYIRGSGSGNVYVTDDVELYS